MYIGFDVRKAEVLNLIKDYDRDETGRVDFADFADISKIINIRKIYY